MWTKCSLIDLIDDYRWYRTGIWMYIKPRFPSYWNKDKWKGSNITGWYTVFFSCNKTSVSLGLAGFVPLTVVPPGLMCLRILCYYSIALSFDKLVRLKKPRRKYIVSMFRLISRFPYDGHEYFWCIYRACHDPVNICNYNIMVLRYSRFFSLSMCCIIQLNNDNSNSYRLRLSGSIALKEKHL